MASKIFEKEEASQRATILAIGTANPTNYMYQTDYPDFYFKVTNSEHLTHLKQKFKIICEKSGIQKRHLHLNEEILRVNPNICKYGAPSLNARQEMTVEEVPKLGKEAAMKAIEEWGQPVSKITHLVFCTSSSNSMPGPDYQLSKLLGLRPSVGRFLFFQQGCFGVATALRLAKDVAENNAGARVLVVASDLTPMSFHAPSETHIDILIGQAIFGDGAAAAIIGADIDAAVEQPLFNIVAASQTLIPDSEDGAIGSMRENGISYYMSRKTPQYISQNIKKCLVDACPIAIDDFNSLFYVIHPGGRLILDQIEEKLGLEEGKLEASRNVLREYGNMAGPTVLFALDEMRKKSKREGRRSTGEGLKWGVLLAMGPGLTLEALTLHSVPIAQV